MSQPSSIKIIPPGGTETAEIPEFRVKLEGKEIADIKRRCRLELRIIKRMAEASNDFVLDVSDDELEINTTSAGNDAGNATSQTEKPTKSFASSYMLQFPPSFYPLPADITNPPFVIFSKMGRDISTHLPPNIPLKMILHFSPKFKDYIVRLPVYEVPAVTHTHLLNPTINIDVPRKFSVNGFAYVIQHMMTASGIPVPRLRSEAFWRPNILACLRIMRAWSIFRLPISGTDALQLHIISHLMAGHSPSPDEIAGAWVLFPHNGPHMKAFLSAFARRVVLGKPEMSENQKRKAERLLYRDAALANRITAALELVCAQEVQRMRREPQMGGAVAEEVREMEGRRRGVEETILERGRTRRVSASERRQRQDTDLGELRRRLERSRSVSRAGVNREGAGFPGLE